MVSNASDLDFSLESTRYSKINLYGELSLSTYDSVSDVVDLLAAVQVSLKILGLKINLTFGHTSSSYRGERGKPPGEPLCIGFSVNETLRESTNQASGRLGSSENE